MDVVDFPDIETQVPWTIFVDLMRAFWLIYITKLRSAVSVDCNSLEPFTCFNLTCGM